MKKNWFRWNDLLDRWRMVKDELLEELKKGLQPYLGIKEHEIFCCPYNYHIWGLLENKLKELKDFEINLCADPRYEHYPKIALEETKNEKKSVIEQLRKIKNAENLHCLSWKNLGPLTPELRKNLHSLMEDAIFKVDDVLLHEKKFGFELKTGKEKTTQKDIIEEIDPSIKDQKNVFLRLGKNWIVKFNGKTVTFQNYERIRYIVHLLNKPSVKINVADLYHAVKKENIREKIEGQSDAIKSAEKEINEWESIPDEELSERGVSLSLTGLMN